MAFKYVLFLDDERFPAVDNSAYTGTKLAIVICRTPMDFKRTVNQLGYPSHIFWDNDLGTEIEGKDLAKWLLDQAIEQSIIGYDVPFIDWTIQSQNPVASRTIEGYMQDIRRLYHEQFDPTI